MDDYSHIEKPAPGYRYEFGMDELGEVFACVDVHGFSIVKEALPLERVETLKRAVRKGQIRKAP